MFTQVTICYKYPLSNVQVTGSGREQAVETLSTAQWQLQVLSQLDFSSLDFHFDFHSHFSHRNISIALKAFISWQWFTSRETKIFLLFVLNPLKDPSVSYTSFYVNFSAFFLFTFSMDFFIPYSTLLSNCFTSALFQAALSRYFDETVTPYRFALPSLQLLSCKLCNWVRHKSKAWWRRPSLGNPFKHAGNSSQLRRRPRCLLRPLHRSRWSSSGCADRYLIYRVSQKMHY